jgi:hypothetical protein
MLYFLLFTIVDSNQIIKNINVPSCRNCIYYKPPYYSDYSSSVGKCNKFGTKDVITDKIVYDFADMSRTNENKCGNEGKYFELEKFVEFKIFMHQLIKNLPNILIVSILVIQFLSLLK